MCSFVKIPQTLCNFDQIPQNISFRLKYPKCGRNQTPQKQFFDQILQIVYSLRPNTPKVVSLRPNYLKCCVAFTKHSKSCVISTKYPQIVHFDQKLCSFDQIRQNVVSLRPNTPNYFASTKIPKSSNIPKCMHRLVIDYAQIISTIAPIGYRLCSNHFDYYNRYFSMTRHVSINPTF